MSLKKYFSLFISNSSSRLNFCIGVLTGCYGDVLFKVQPKHVKEAFRLLNKSIIRVETPDVQFDEEEQQEGKKLFH